MYEQDGLQDHYYMILYGAATMFAALAGLYLLFRHHNALSDTEPPLVLRRWTGSSSNEPRMVDSNRHRCVKE